MEPISGNVPVEKLKSVCPLDNKRLADVIMQFVRVYNEPAGIQLYNYQLVFMHRSVEAILADEGAVLTALWCRQSGKSEAVASLASSLCIILPALAKAFPDDPRLSRYREGFWIGIFAPKQQQSGIIYGRIRQRAQRESSLEIYSDPDINVAVAASRGDLVSWTNGSFVTAQTASESSTVEGLTFHLIIIDEAQLVGEVKLSKEIAPMLAATNGSMIKIGTANALRGNFRKSIIYNVETEKLTGKRNHFEFPYTHVIVDKRRRYEETKDPKHLAYEKWVSGELKRLGGNIENEEFRQNFRLLWQEANAGAIDRDAFAEAGDYLLEAVTSGYSRRYVAGLDYGRKRDCTILTIAEVDDVPIIDMRAVIRPGEDTPTYHTKRIVAWYEIPGRKWHDILAAVVEALGRYSVDTVVCDATGIGDPLTEQLQGLVPGMQVVPFMMSHVGNDKAYKYYIQELEAGRMRYAAGEEMRKSTEFQQFVHEHEELLKDRVGVFIRCFAPEGDHDDYCDSAALCCWAAAQPRVDAGAEAVDNPFYATRGGRQDFNPSRADRYRR
jgi:hypothetical protein